MASIVIYLGFLVAAVTAFPTPQIVEQDLQSLDGHPDLNTELTAPKPDAPSSYTIDLLRGNLDSNASLRTSYGPPPEDSQAVSDGDPPAGDLMTMLVNAIGTFLNLAMGLVGGAIGTLEKVLQGGVATIVNIFKGKAQLAVAHVQATVPVAGSILGIGGELLGAKNKVFGAVGQLGGAVAAVLAGPPASKRDQSHFAKIQAAIPELKRAFGIGDDGGEAKPKIFGAVSQVGAAFANALGGSAAMENPNSNGVEQEGYTK